MSKRIRNSRNTIRTINGWPANKVMVFRQFNNAAFYVPNPEFPEFGFTIAINSHYYYYERHKLNNPDRLFKVESASRLVGVNQEHIKEKHLEVLDYWMSYEKFKEAERKQGISLKEWKRAKGYQIS